MKIICFVFFVFFFALFIQNECFEIKRTWDKIMRPIESVFTKEHSNEDNDLDMKEHGHLDNPVRDLIRETSKTIDTIKDKIKKTFSKVTSGLDCNKTLAANGDVEKFKSSVRAIFPGTKWCGDGSVARSYDDVGKFSSVDMCCRDHDMCPDNIAASSSKYGLDNTGLFTRSHCDCDRKFYECLKQAGGFVGNSIGYTYFTVLGPQCFEQDYPLVDCVEERKGRCELYWKDEEGEKVYQWLDNPVF